jgi:calcineurin-like phosphoesterase family protein
MATFLTSDTHFGHRLMAAERGFSSTEEMDGALVAAWNGRVGDKDEVYHLGDLSFRRAGETEGILRRLKGRKHLLFGNHDKESRRAAPRWVESGLLAWAREYHELRVPSSLLECGKVVLCHYAFEVWNKSHYGSVHLHGHSHGSLPRRGRRMDVGVDTRPDHAPWSLEECVLELVAREPHTPDHHASRVR